MFYQKNQVKFLSKTTLVVSTILLTIGASLVPFASNAATVATTTAVVVPGAPVDQTIKSVVQIIIIDNVSGNPVKTGSGVSLGGSSILTNYHVASELIEQPNRYIAIVCVPSAVSVEASCVYSASANEKFNMTINPVFDKALDLAIININWQYSNRAWTKIVNGEGANSYLSSPITSVKSGLSTKTVNVGDEVTTLGFPDFGHGKLTMSKGSVKEFTSINGNTMIGTDAKIGHGSSGGAAFGKDGELLGITSGGNFDPAGNFIEGYIMPVTSFNGLGSQAVIAPVTQTVSQIQPAKTALAYNKLLKRTYAFVK